MRKIFPILLLIIFLCKCNYSKKNGKAMNNYDKIITIERFIQAYNSFDIDGMLKDIHDDIKFENITNGRIDLATNGIDEFKKQVESAATYFKVRQEKVIDVNFKEDKIEVNIDYFGILDKDLSDDLKSGDTLRLKGKSIFKFKDNKIISIQDITE